MLKTSVLLHQINDNKVVKFRKMSRYFYSIPRYA